jgi:hypothetical protein
LEPWGKAGQTAAVGRHGIIRQMAFGAEVVLIGVQVAASDVGRSGRDQPGPLACFGPPARCLLAIEFRALRVALLRGRFPLPLHDAWRLGGPGSLGRPLWGLGS